MTDTQRSRAAVYLDRDGVINELVPDAVSGRPESPLRVSDVTLISGVTTALARLREAGYALIGASNQPAAAKGTAARRDLLQVHARVMELLGADGVTFDAFELCLHHPEAVVPELRGPCACRKPAPGMLLTTAAALGIDLAGSWMVGDTDTDTAAGQAAGCRTILVEHPGGAHKRLGSASPTATARDLAAAADVILVESRG